MAACQPSAPQRVGSEAAESARPGESRGQAGAAVPRCPNEGRVAAGAGRPKEGRLEADLDGRPGTERAWIALTPGGVDCRAWLVAEGSFGRTVVPIAGTDHFAFESLGLPALAGAARIDDTGGAEIVVDVTAGASTTFAAVFTLDRDTAVKVDARGAGAPPGDLFAHGGSAAHVDAVDCTGPATVVISQARADALRYSVTRYYFAAEGPVWRALPRHTESGETEPRLLATRWPEFQSWPFSSCLPPSD